MNVYSLILFSNEVGKFFLKLINKSLLITSSLEGSSKAAIITPRSVTPTSEVKKKKVDSITTGSSTNPTDKKANQIAAKTKESAFASQMNKAKENSPVSSNVSQMKTGKYMKFISLIICEY